MEDKIYKVKYIVKSAYDDTVFYPTIRQEYRTKSYSRALSRYRELSKATKERALEAIELAEKTHHNCGARSLYKEVWIEEGTPRVVMAKKYTYKKLEIS